MKTVVKSHKRKGKSVKAHLRTTRKASSLTRKSRNYDTLADLVGEDNEMVKEKKSRYAKMKKGCGDKTVKSHYKHSYDEETGDMKATFPGGASYRYHGVSPKEYKEVQKDKFKALSRFKKSKTYSPDNSIAKKAFSSDRAKKAALTRASKNKKK